MEFKDRLKQLRKEHNLSQQALADAIFVSRSAVAKWESGLGLPNPDSMQNLLEYFNLSPEQISTSEPELIILDKNRKIHLQKIFIVVSVLLFIITGLLIALSIPRIIRVETTDFYDVPSQLQDEWDWLAAECAFMDLHPESITVVTVGNLWGEWSLQILPVYAMSVRTVPKMGQADWYARLYILSEWSEESFFTHLCALKLRDFTLSLKTEAGAFLLPFADVYSDFDVQVQYDQMDEDIVSISLTEDIPCSNQHILTVKYRVATSGDEVQKQILGESEDETAQFYWNYTLRACGRKVITCQDTVILQKYTVNV